jgi:two-component system LytT family sensor kinase
MSSPTTYNSRFYTILVHLLIWAAFFLFPLLFLDTGSERERYAATWWILILLSATYFYLNYNLLIPKFLLRKQLLLYTLLVIVSLALVVFMAAGYFHLYDRIGENLRQSPHLIPRRAILVIFPAIIAFALSSTIRVTNEWFRNEKRKGELENEKLASELAFLKSQVNPHFLFNILNNICSLARKKSDDTENAIIKLSQLMRYMLDDSKEQKVALSKELDYLDNYIELQRLRISDKAEVVVKVEGDTESYLIEPLLLIPFVENAFKHGISYLEHSKIEIALSVEAQRLSFTVLNTNFKDQAMSLPAEEGIGLKNVRRRLDLLYPGKHTLTVEDADRMYKIFLEIRFS